MWFTETPWPPIIGISILGVLLFLGFLSQWRTGFLAGACLCVALCGIVFVVEQLIVTESEVVEQRLLDLVETFQRESREIGLVNALVPGPEPQTLNFISPNAREVRGMVVGALRMVDLEDDVRISDVRTTLSNNNSRAVIHFRASATVRQFGHRPTRWELTWQREQNEWRVIGATRLNFLTGKALDNPFVGGE